jgi:hypothetical protein
MKSVRSLVAGLAVLGCLCVWGCNKDETTTDTRTPGQKAGDAVARGVDRTTQAARDAGHGLENAATQVAGTVSPTGATSLSGMRNVLEGVAQNAANRNNFKDVCSYFLNADETRIVGTKPKTKDLDDQIDLFQKAWKDKYQTSFGVHDVDKTYDDSFVHLAQDTANPKMGTATIVASHGMPEVVVPMMQEAGKWKIDVPDTLDGAKLKANLLQAITDLIKSSSTWPDSDVEASRAVTHHVMMAVMDKM